VGADFVRDLVDCLQLLLFRPARRTSNISSYLRRALSVAVADGVGVFLEKDPVAARL
jgi:hypothetical protein